jgi:5S rRNA maturation endonuclease (ribonuclease M5)
VTDVSNIFGHLPGLRKSGDGWVAQCPAHDDKKASLSIHERDGKILSHCHAGCTPEAVCQAAGIEMRDLFLGTESPKASRPRRASKELVATYDYVDEGGALCFQVCRFKPKDFRQRRPDGKGGWTWDLDGVRRVLYRLPELLSASEILIVEGEKDVETAHALGFVATCNPGGAGKWRDEYSEFLRSKSVVLIPDADDPGRKHGQQVLSSLAGKASNLKLIELSGAKDLTEWAELGGNQAALRELITRAADWAPQEGATLLSQIVDFIRAYVVLSEPQALIVGLWVLHTHAFDASDATPYLSITSVEKQSGKSRLLEVLELLVSNPWLTGRVTAAVLVRKIDKCHPTLLLDESDAAFKENDEYAEVLRGVLNTGHRRSGKASCCVGQGANIDFKDFETYSPKALAGIGNPPDTVADRSIPIRLKRRTREERVNRFRRRKAEAEAIPLRDGAAAWAARVVGRLKTLEPELPDGLSDRQQDCAEPLVAIADLLGQGLPEQARGALLELFFAGVRDDESFRTQLLRDIRVVFEDAEPADKLASEALAEKLAAIETSPWAESNHGKPLTKVQLARLLKPYVIAPRTIRLHDGSTPKGDIRRDFMEAWERYLPLIDSPENATMPQLNVDAGPEQISKRHTERPVAGLKTEETSISTASVADVSVQMVGPANQLASNDGEDSVSCRYHPEPVIGGGWRCECGVEGDDPLEWSKHTGARGCPLKSPASLKTSQHIFGKSPAASRRQS